MKDWKTKSEESTRLTYTGLRHSSRHTYLETSVSHYLKRWMGVGGVPHGLCFLGASMFNPACVVYFVDRWNESTGREVVYSESRNRELKTWLMNESRCDKRLKSRVEESTFLTYPQIHWVARQNKLEIRTQNNLLFIMNRWSESYITYIWVSV
jgi:hypothetical protein